MIEAAQHIDPQAVAVHRLSPALRRSYDSWRAENAAIHARFEATEGLGAVYARLMDGEDVTLPMPSDVAAALNVPAMPIFTADMTLGELERRYAEMIRANPVRTNKRKNFRAIVNEN